VADAPRSGQDIHRHRDVAESFGSDAARYDRARPDYPDAMVQAVLAASPGRFVLDVGTGTGIAARRFLAAGCQVFGVDPDDRMAAVARAAGIDVEVATFEAWQPAGKRFDVVVAGQAWHWIDPVAGAAKAGEVLRRGGRLAVFWNAFDPPAELARAFADVYERVDSGMPFNPWAKPSLDGYEQMAGRAADGMREADGFDEPERWRFDWARPYTKAEWLDQVPTTGGHSGVPAPALDALLDGIGAAVDAHGGTFTMRYATVVATARRTL
jgi:SAM-dependent methyltransferase